MFKFYEIETSEDIKSVLQAENTFFVFDTNVLLNLYAYQYETLEQIFTSIDYVKERVFIPFQVRLEFENRRLSVISNNLNKYNKLKNILNDGKETIYRSITDQQVYKEQIKFIHQKLDDVISEITRRLDEQKKNFVQIRGEDYIKNKLFNEFRLNIGELNEEYFVEHENYKNLKKELDERFSKRIPPGFEDANKDKDDMPYIIYGEKTLERKYGDVFFLYEIIDNFKDFDEFNLVIISEEKKKDWVIQVDCEGKKVLGVLPQIKQQIYAKNEKVQRIILMDTLSFIKDLADIKHQTLSDQVVSDVEKMNMVIPTKYYNNDYIGSEPFLAHLKNMRSYMFIEKTLEVVLSNLSEELEPLIKYSQSMLRTIKDTGEVYSYSHCQDLIDDFIFRHHTKFIDACSEYIDKNSFEQQDVVSSVARKLIDTKIHAI